MKKYNVALILVLLAWCLVACYLIRTNYNHVQDNQLLDAYCQGWHDSERWKDEAPLTRELRFEVDSLCFKVKLLER